MSPIRPQFKTYPKNRDPVPRPESIKYNSEDFLGGLVTDASPEIIPPNALQYVKNVQFIRNQLFRRNGLQAYNITKPDSLRILAIFTFFHSGTGINFLRFTSSSIYRAGSSGWTHITGAALSGTNNDQYSFTVADNRCFFSNGGANVIQEINPTAATYAPLGNAPKYKYLAAAYNRVIGANLRAVTDVPYQIGWSGDLNYGEWDPSVDISAGFTPLVNSPSDLSDAITGVYSLSSVICITRERSIWLATNLPSATNPFNFYVAVPRIGCDVPRTITLAADGLIFYNYQTSTVYFYAPGEQPQEISQAVKRAIKNDVNTPDNLFASYNYDTNTYSLFIQSNTSSLVKCYSYSFRSKVWTYDEYYNVTTVNDIDYASSDLTINELTGTIASLSGTIDQLGGLVANANRFFGFNNGDLCSQPLFTGFQDAVSNIVLTDNGTVIPTEIQSKTFSDPTDAQLINYVQLDILPFTTGTVSVYYSRDDGLTWTKYKDITYTNADLYQSDTILARKAIRCKGYIWKLTSNDCMFTLRKYYILAEPSGIST